MEKLNIRDIVHNVKDELQRAIERIKELGEIQTETVTDDDILVDDMANSLERMEDLMERIEFALILANYVGVREYRNNEVQATDNSYWREKYLETASQIDFEYQDGYIDSEWAYNTATDLVEELIPIKSEMKVIEMNKDTLLWNALKQHIGHNVEIVCYGDKENPHDICLECTDCNEVILDAEIYTLCAREDE